jgi:V/A-type H+-transporting ATPase subunit I
VALETTVRFGVICLQDEALKIMDYLAHRRSFHPEIKAAFREHHNIVEAASGLSQKLARIDFCLAKLKKLRTSGGLKEALEDSRKEMTLEELKERAENLDVSWIYEEIVLISERLEKIGERLAEIEKKYSVYACLSDLNIQKKDLIIQKDRKFAVFLFKGRPKFKLEVLEKSLPSQTVFFKDISAKENNSGIFAVIAHLSVKDEAYKAMLDAGLEPVVPDEEMQTEETFRHFLNRLLLEKGELLKQKVSLEEKLRQYLAYLDDLKAAYEWYWLEKEKYEKYQAFTRTRRCTLIDGWVPESIAEKLKRELETNFVCEVILEPEKQNPLKPVILKNKGPVASLEILTELYGYPAANEPDPTPAIAPWFLLFFGFCIGDVGYGSLLTILGLFLKRNFKLKPAVKSFADIFIYGGLGAILIGILTGSYFALDEKLLPHFLLRFKLFDPVTNPVGILGLSIVLGFLHILLGIAYNAYLLLKEDFKSLRFLAEIGKMFLLIGVGIYLGLFFGGMQNPSLFLLAKYAAVAGVLFVVFFSAGGPRGFIRRILTGLYNLYGMSSYLGDISSYARLMALMLAGLLIGLAVNIMSKMFIELLGSYAGLPLAILIAVVGHLFNLLLSVVSAFIHSLRLQFVEFFKQFYSDGGIKFNPLGIKEKYIKIAD